MNRNKNTNAAKGGKNKKGGYTGKSKSGSNKNFDYAKERDYFEKKTNNHATDYFSDQALAEQNSYVSSRAIIESATTIPDTNIPYPSVIVHAYNPSVSVGPIDIVTGSVQPSSLSQAATKLLVAIMANTGRIVNYTKNDIIALIAMLGQFIAMTSYARRVFGLYNRFNMINRDIPKQFIEACGFDWDDFKDNYYTYLSQTNWLINQSAQFVIPMDKIPYFRRCRDQFQDVYKDASGGMTMYHINVPYSTWILDELSSENGSILRTINVTGPHNASYYDSIFHDTHQSHPMTIAQFGASRRQPHALWTYQDFLDQVYAPLINSIFESNTFNLIFTDLRNAKFQAQYSFEFWHADTIMVDYMTDIKDPQEDIMTMYHNTTIVGAPVSDHNVVDQQTGRTLVTKFNDVVLEGSTDNLAYNPAFWTRAAGPLYDWNRGTLEGSQLKLYHDDLPIVMDFKDDNPSLDIRVDTMMQKVAQYDNFTDAWATNEQLLPYASHVNYILPLWYCVGVYAKSEYKFNRQYSSLGSEYSIVMDDLLNGWFVVSPVDGHLYLPIIGDMTGNMAVEPINVTIDPDGQEYVNIDTDHIMDFKVASLASSGSEIVMMYPDGSVPGEVTFTSTESWSQGLAVTKISQSGFRGNVDSWYVLPKVKLINMFNHAYQHLFTADGITK